MSNNGLFGNIANRARKSVCSQKETGNVTGASGRTDDASGSYTDENYKALANAIILKAVDDYRCVLHFENRTQDNPSIKERRDEIEEFFNSTWFAILTEINPQWLMKRLQDEAAEKRRPKWHKMS